MVQIYKLVRPNLWDHVPNNSKWQRFFIIIIIIIIIIITLSRFWCQMYKSLCIYIYTCVWVRVRSHPETWGWVLLLGAGSTQAGHGASWLLASYGTKSYRKKSQCHKGSCGNCPGDLVNLWGFLGQALVNFGSFSRDKQVVRVYP